MKWPGALFTTLTSTACGATCWSSPLAMKTPRGALQGALVRVTRHIKVFRDETAFWSWLTVLARSAFADETRKQRRYFSFLDRFTRHASAGTVAAGSELRIEEIPLTVYCQACLSERSPLPGHGLVCPQCGAVAATIVHGRELELVAMEIDS